MGEGGFFLGFCGVLCIVFVYFLWWNGVLNGGGLVLEGYWFEEYVVYLCWKVEDCW